MNGRRHARKRGRALRNALRAARRFVVFRSVRLGDTVHFIGRGRLYVATDDNRGHKVLTTNGVTQPAITYLWRKLVAMRSPGLALDVGANYGEIAMAARYPPRCEVLVVEPHPKVVPLLRKSIRSHRDGAMMHVIDRLVSDTEGEHPFYVDEKWSGTSSAIGMITDHDDGFKGEGGEKFSKIMIPSITIDSLTRRYTDLNARDIVFKIDVEGFEGRVVSGMKNTLDRVRSFVGLIEVDADYLDRSGADVGSLVDYFAAIGSVRLLDRRGVIRRITSPRDIGEHANLIVASDEGLLQDLSVPRIIRKWSSRGEETAADGAAGSTAA